MTDDAARKLVWPAYLVAAACLAIAIVSSVSDIALRGEVRSMQTDVTRDTERSTSLARRLDESRTALADLLSADAKHYEVDGGAVVTRGSHLYIAMQALPQPPRGKVYQAWTLAKGADKAAPSLTFVPDAHGVAVIAIPVDARATAVVTVTIEPEGGSKQPTTKPIASVTLT